MQYLLPVLFMLISPTFKSECRNIPDLEYLISLGPGIASFFGQWSRFDVIAEMIRSC